MIISGLRLVGTSCMGKGIEPSKSITILQSLATSSRQVLELLGIEGLFAPFLTKEVVMWGMAIA